MKATTIGIDLAKHVFQIHGVNELGKATLRKQLKRVQMAEFFATLPPSVIGMEACGSAHHWARKLQSFGHTVRLMAPQFVKPYVKTTDCWTSKLIHAIEHVRADCHLSRLGAYLARPTKNDR